MILTVAADGDRMTIPFSGIGRQRPEWMDEATYATVPDKLEIREVRLPDWHAWLSR